MIDTDVLDIVFMCTLKSYMNTFLDIFDLLMSIDIVDHMNGTFEMICEYYHGLQYLWMRQAVYHFNGVTYTLMNLKRLLWHTVDRFHSRFDFVPFSCEFDLRHFVDNIVLSFCCFDSFGNELRHRQ